MMRDGFWVGITVLNYGGGVEAMAGAEVTAKTAVGLSGCA